MIVKKLSLNWWQEWSKQQKLLTIFYAWMVGIIIFNAETIVYNSYLLTYKWQYNPNLKLSMMINSVMGIPYMQEPQYRNDSPDLRRLSKEEWLSLPYFRRSIKIDRVEDKLNLIQNIPTTAEVEHATSLVTTTPGLHINKASNTLLGKLCSGLFSCDAISIVVQDYALKKPEILTGIMQIARRPCDYIRTIKEVKPSDEVVFSYDFTYELFGFINFKTNKYNQRDIQEGINAAKAVFTCDKKSFWEGGGLKSLPIFKRKFVVIMINDEGIVRNVGDKSLDIVVTREDI